ncbi:unnamed protein product [Rhizoctonia solani]|uniref:Ricin B lectin domain-containing protein n=1 Tax=Rhizoctonia solani TaxID=456999 RepID=A0A8H3CC85_9AGAM|nr:unnamed protein product [Rhizoctonia solani]
MRDSPGNRSSQVIPNHTGALYDSPPNPFFLSPTLPLRSNLPPSAPGQGEEAKIQTFETTRDNTERFQREPSAESLDNTIATGAYIITNAETKDEAALDDTHQELNLVGASGECELGKIWSVERLSNGRYTIKNARNAMFASHETCPKEESTVYANKDAKEWIIEESTSTDQHFIKCTEADLYWGLEVSVGKKVIVLRSGENDKRNLWRLTQANISDTLEAI